MNGSVHRVTGSPGVRVVVLSPVVACRRWSVVVWAECAVNVSKTRRVRDVSTLTSAGRGCPGSRVLVLAMGAVVWGLAGCGRDECASLDRLGQKRTERASWCECEWCHSLHHGL